MKRAGQPLGEDFHFGLCIRSDDKGHIGIVYQFKGDHLLHLVWHHNLKTEPFIDPQYVACQFAEELENRIYLAACASTFASIKHSPIPYSFVYPVIAFDKGKGYRYTNGVPGQGLTCATFVMKFLEAYGFELVQDTTWLPRMADQADIDKILTGLEQWLNLRGKGLTHVHEARKMLATTVRFKPIEVFCAATMAPEKRPSDQNSVASIIKDVVQRIQAA